MGFPGGSDSKEICLQCRRPRFNPCVKKIPWRMEWLPTPVFWPREFHGQRSLVGYGLWGGKRVRHDLGTKQQQIIEMGRIKTTTTTTARKYVMATFMWVLCNTFAENSLYTVSICTLRPIVGFFWCHSILIPIFMGIYFYCWMNDKSHRKKIFKHTKQLGNSI